MSFELVNNSVRDAVCPEKLLKVQGRHINYRIVSYRNRSRLFTVSLNAKQRTCANDIKASIHLEELERGPRLRAILNLIENKDRFPRYKSSLEAQKGGEHHDEIAHLGRNGEYGGVIGVFKEIQYTTCL